MTNRKKIIEEILTSFLAIKRRIVLQNNHLSNITFAQAQVLRTVKENEGIGVKEIAKSLRISSSAAVQLIDGLADNDYLIRESNPEDRRALKIRFSDKAKEHFNEMRARGLKKMSVLFEVLNEDELLQFCKLSKKIIDNILPKD